MTIIASPQPLRQLPHLNWRYAVGKTLSNVGNAALASPLLPLTRAIPAGISYPYDIKRILRGQPLRTIVDAGANIGQTSLFLRKHFPQADLWAFEPFSPAFKELQAQTQRFKTIHPLAYALGETAQTLERPVRENSELNTLVDSNCRADETLLGSETIEVKRLDQIAQDRAWEGIDLLKMDVQGYELSLLRGAERLLEQNRIKLVYSEISFEPDNAECAYFETINQFLERYNFRFSGFYETFRWGNQKRYFGFCNALFVHRHLP
jgi:FkbM family methyltransferase